MNEEHTEKLYKDFPNLYCGKDKTLQESLMPFGFMCGDGWFKLIHNLSRRITKLDPEGRVEAVEVKEKFGGLRFYINAAPKEIHDLIQVAEDKSYHICEECGHKGKIRDDIGWYRTLCEQHYKEVKYGPKKHITKLKPFKHHTNKRYKGKK